MYTPDFWPLASGVLDVLLSNKNDTVAGQVLAAFSAPSTSRLFEAYAGIRCSDSALRANNLADVLPIVNSLYATSFVGGDSLALTLLTCTRWRFHAKGRYQGGFQNIRTKYPLLFIGNTFDPVTPLVSARNASAGFEGSVVLQHNGHGVGYFPSICFASLLCSRCAPAPAPEKDSPKQSS